jgi:hypothetical protein
LELLIFRINNLGENSSQIFGFKRLIRKILRINNLALIRQILGFGDFNDLRTKTLRINNLACGVLGISGRHGLFPWPFIFLIFDLLESIIYRNSPARSLKLNDLKVISLEPIF